MDSNLFWVFLGTAIVSVLTVIYVLVDEEQKKRRYEQQPKPPVKTAEESSQPQTPLASEERPVETGSQAVEESSPKQESPLDTPQLTEESVLPPEKGLDDSQTSSER